MTDSPSKPPSLQDVARRAGVAVSTVSRALTMPGRISAQTRERVQAAAEELGYRPNLAARQLRRGGGDMLLILMPDFIGLEISNTVPFIVNAVQERALQSGYSVMQMTLSGGDRSNQKLMDLVQGGQIAGILLLISDVPVIGGRSLAAAGVPLVAVDCDHSAEGMPSVVSENRAALRRLTRMILEAGHRRLAYVTGPADSWHETERRSGIAEAMAGWDGPLPPLVCLPGGFNVETGTAAADAFLTLAPRPTALLCWSDEIALGVLRRLQEAGLRVPGEVSLTGFDGLKVTAYTWPSLATIGQDSGRIGWMATEALLHLVEDRAGPVAPFIEVPATFLRGESLGPAPQG